jgi:hypothetical protein
MASTTSTRLPWYKRLFSRSAPAAPAPAQPPPKVSKVTYYCDVCGFADRNRGIVFEHVKVTHKDVLDRHSRIREQPQSSPQARSA